MPRIRYLNIQQRPRNPLVQILAMLGGLLVFAAAFVLGFFLLAVLLGLLLLLGLGVYLRIWWLRRKFTHGAESDNVLETEYHVVDRNTDREQRGDRR